MSERAEQAALFEWADIMSGQYPPLARMFAIPNGQFRPGTPKEPGLKSGVPDVFLPVPRSGFAGLFIEMKFGRNKPSKKQADWLAFLRGAGFRCAVCYGADDAIRLVSRYLGIGEK